MSDDIKGGSTITIETLPDRVLLMVRGKAGEEIDLEFTATEASAFSQALYLQALKAADTTGDHS